MKKYSLNGEKFASSENALIDHRFEVTGLLKPGKNTLAVDLRSPMLCAASKSVDAYCTICRNEFLRLRKAPSCHGWDIMPRTLSAGLWRDVDLEIEGNNEFDSLFLATRALEKDAAVVTCAFRFRTDAPCYDGLSLRLTGTVEGEPGFVEERSLRFVAGRFDFTVKNPKLWWLYGYGPANVYDVRAEILRGGRVLAALDTQLGIRTVKLERTDITDSYQSEFYFHVNGEKILCKGSDWVPADALHGRDASRYERMLSLWTDTGSNILRCWGGNVYEDHPFYDYYDRHGIMIWKQSRAL